MDLHSKKTSLLILVITALVCSRAMFALFNDPEGPNLLIVVVMAALLYALSLVAYLFKFPGNGLKKLLLAIIVQVIIATVLYFLLS
jgi:FtsH-binding integral membrane protein